MKTFTRVLFTLCALTSAAHFMRFGTLWDALPALILVPAVWSPKFLPRPLLEPPLDLVGDPTAAAGLRHMLDLQEFCRTHGEEKAFSGDARGVRLTVMRARVE